jgi:hypothetical protein
MLFAILLSGCETYHLTTKSLVDQFANSNTEKKKILLPVPPYVFFIDPVTGNDLKTLTCLDSIEHEKIINITNRTGIRITRLDNSRTTFYINTLLLKDSSITGSKTHFFNMPIKPINISDILKLEVQE